MNKTALVNTFLGCEPFDFDRLTGLTKKWFHLKAQIGNTAPASRYPFGLVSCCGYSGGYPTGYGVYAPNYIGRPKRFINTLKLSGLTHFQLSGTGAIGKYYNFVKVTPLYNNDNKYLQNISQQEAKVGYYAVYFEDSRCHAECSVGKNYAYHKYMFDNGGTIAIDLAQSGLSTTFAEKFRKPVEVSEVTTDKDTAQCKITTENVHLFCGIKAKNAKLNRIENNVIYYDVAKCAEFKIAFSLENFSNSSDILAEATDFSATLSSNNSAWEECLAKIEVDCYDRALFYTMMYLSCINPTYLNGERYLGGLTTTNYCTLWDMYKTQLPLLYSLFGALSTEIVQTLADTKGVFGYIPNGLMISDNGKICAEQAQLLAVFCIYDAFTRDSANVKWSKIFSALYAEFNDGKYIEKLGKCAYPYHHLNISLAINCLHDMAVKLHETDASIALKAHIGRELDVFTHGGLLSPKGAYYEGGYKNYSFQIMPDMAKRIALFDTKKDYKKALDSYFGYKGVTPIQAKKTAIKLVEKVGLHLGRFEGYNNEPDMETPYNYIFIGNCDRTYDIVSNGMSLYKNSADGIPGNEDSGGLSSCYIWNMLGVFPIGGQNKMMLSTPLLRSASMNLCNGNTIKIVNNSEHKASTCVYFNDTKIEDRLITATLFMQGGTIRFE